MIDYASIAAGALSALTDAGQTMTLYVPGEATYSPTTGTASTSPAAHACTGVLLPIGAIKGSDYTFSPDLLVRARAVAYIGASGLSATPSPGCSLLVGGETWEVLGTDTINPAGVPVLHVCALGRG